MKPTPVVIVEGLQVAPQYYFHGFHLLCLLADPLHQGGIEVKKEKGMKSADVAQGEDEKRDAVNQTEESKHTTAIPG